MESKIFHKWELSYATYKKGLKHGNESSLVLDLDDGDPNTCGPSIIGCASWPRSDKATKKDLKHDAYVIALHETLKGLMVAKEEGNAKRIEK
jgi:hypothetical protein